MGRRVVERDLVRGKTQLLVDGYNVLHAWNPERRRAREEMAMTRDSLVDAVRVIADTEPVAVTVVFDGRAPFAETEFSGAEGAVRVLFAPAGLTADGAIERLVAADGKTHRCIVVTADRMERETVTAAGAECITPAELAQWIDRCRQRARRRSQSGGKFENKLPL